MLRCVHRTVPPTQLVTLEFLLPRYYGGYSRNTSLIPAMQIRTPVNHNPIPPPAPSGSGARPVPIPWSPPPQDEPRLSEDHAGSLTHKQIKLFNEITSTIRSSLEARNIRAALACWSHLAEQQLLHLCGRTHYDQYCRILVEMGNEQSFADLTEDELSAFEEMALLVAAGGSSEALKQLMLRKLRDALPDAVIRLYTRYLSLLKERTDIIWHVSDGAEEASSSGDGEAVEDASASLRGKPTLSIHRAFPLYTIAAYAIQDSLPDALRIALQAPASIDIAGINHAILDLQRSRLTKEQVRRAREFMLNCQLAIRVHRPANFATYISINGRGRSFKTLQMTYNKLIEVLTSKDSWIALHPADVSKTRPVLLPDFSWASWLSAFLQCRALEAAESMWDDMARLGVQPTSDVWVALIDGYTDLRMAERARGAWSMIIHGNVPTTAMMWRAIIAAEFAAGNDAQALTRFQEFVKQSSKPSASVDTATSLVVYNTVLHRLLGVSREKEAGELFERMRQQGPAPDIVTYNTFMRYHTKKGDIKALAETLQAMNAAHLKGDIYTYSIVLEALIPVREDAVQIVFGLMKQHNIKPNVVTYTSIIRHLLQQRTKPAFKAAMTILRRMEAEDEAVRPNDVTYTAILTELYRDNWLDPEVVEETVQLLTDRMRERNLFRTATTYNLLMKACLENPAPSGLTDAMKYFNEMRSQRVLITSDTWYILLQGLRARKELGMATELVDVIGRECRDPSSALRELMGKIKRYSTKHPQRGRWD